MRSGSGALSTRGTNLQRPRSRIQQSSSVNANQTLWHGTGNQHIWIKNSVDSNRKPDYRYANRTPLVDFYCKRVTIIASG